MDCLVCVSPIGKYQISLFPNSVPGPSVGLCYSLHLFGKQMLRSSRKEIKHISCSREIPGHDPLLLLMKSNPSSCLFDLSEQTAPARSHPAKHIPCCRGLRNPKLGLYLFSRRLPQRVARTPMKSIFSVCGSIYSFQPLGFNPASTTAGAFHLIWVKLQSVL